MRALPEPLSTQHSTSSPLRAPFPFPPALTVALLALTWLIPALASPAWAAPQGQEEVGEAVRQEGEQATSDLSPGRRAEVYRVRHGDAHELARIARAFGVHAQAQEEMAVISLRGLEADLQVALEVLEKLDTPPAPTASVLLKLHVLRASKEEVVDGLPGPLQDVGEQLRQGLGYEGLELMDTLVVRGRDGGDVSLEGSLGGAHHFNFAVRTMQMLPRGDGAPVVRLENLGFVLRTPDPSGEGGPTTTSLGTDVEVREGQQVVVGKATSAGGSGAVVLVLEATVE